MSLRRRQIGRSIASVQLAIQASPSNFKSCASYHGIYQDQEVGTTRLENHLAPAQGSVMIHVHVLDQPSMFHVYKAGLI